MSCLLISLLAIMGGVPAHNDPIVLFDAIKCLETLKNDSVLQYDTLNFVSSLQGVVNRDHPRLLIRFQEGAGISGNINIDDYWLEKMQTGWLKGRAITRVDTLDRILELFPEARAGVVVWDPEVLATSNVAATICGVEGWIPVRADSVFYKQIVESSPRIPVKCSLVGKFTGAATGSKKCDAYLWAKREYLDKGRCNDALMANYIDAYTQVPSAPGFHYHNFGFATLTNHDYFIAKKAFFFDLGPWADEAPVDDPKQKLGTDRETLKALLKSMYDLNRGKKITSVGGFVPWNLKYTNSEGAGGKHDPVATEWEYAAVLSSYNAIMDADALGLSCLVNASAYMNYPMKNRYKQNPHPARQALDPKTYVLVYMGDYDAAAWLSQAIPSIWDDPVRGKFPIAWAFNPNLSARVPYVFDYIYRTKSPNDWFIGGDSGAGYLNPNLLTGDRMGSGLPDALKLWVRHNSYWYRRFDYSITGFILNGFHGKVTLPVAEAYARFSPDGAGVQYEVDNPIVKGMPFVSHTSDIYPDMTNLEKTANEMGAFARPDKPQFLIYRMILQRPGTLQAACDKVKTMHPEQNWEFCDPYTFFDLYRQYRALQNPLKQ